MEVQKGGQVQDWHFGHQEQAELMPVVTGTQKAGLSLRSWVMSVLSLHLPETGVVHGQWAGPGSSL